MEVVQFLTNSNDTEFESFYAANIDSAARLAHLATGTASVGLDIAQDAMIALQRRWDDLREPHAFLRRTVLNLCRSRQRRWSRERRWLASHQPDNSIGMPELDETWAVVHRLPRRQREVIILRFYEDLSIDQIAAAIDVPAGTVKSTLHRALATLKGALT